MTIMNNNKLLKMYNPFPFVPQKAEGVYIYAGDGRKYIDTFSGIGVTNFGHSYQPLLARLREKMERYMHLSNFYLDEDAVEVAGKLISYAGKDGRVYFANSGAEATEAALKAVKKISIKNRRNIIYFKSGFHGRTLGALSLNGFKKYREPFEPLFENTVELEYNDAAGLEKYMTEKGHEVVALFIEPVLGSGGIVSLTKEFAGAINSARKKYGFLVVSDEIQAGLGRTGEIYSYQRCGLEPDIITAGKSLGGGLPLGATIFLEQTAEILKFGDHGSTFAPNPVALAGARFILEALPALLPDVRKKGGYFTEKLAGLGSKKIMEVRGPGLMIGVALQNEEPELREAAFTRESLLINVLGNRLIRLLPPLNITFDEIDAICEKLGRILK